MPDFSGPLGLGVVIGGQSTPTPPTGLLFVSSTDQTTFDYLIGKTIIGGSQFADTLGNFSPVIISPKGGLTINSSANQTAAISFHNTATTVTDMLFVAGTASDGVGTVPSLAIAPNSTTPVDGLFQVQDRAAASPNGIAIFPSFTLSGVVAPAILTVIGGAGTVLIHNGKIYTVASATTGAGINIPHGAAPTTPANGDLWTTTAGMFVRINGTTKSVNLT